MVDIQNKVLQKFRGEQVKERITHDLTSPTEEDIIDIIFNPHWNERGYYYGVVRKYRGNSLEVIRPDATIQRIRTYEGSLLKRHQIVKVVYWEGEFLVRAFPTVYDFSTNGYKPLA